MPIRTTAVEAAEARGWNKVELAQRTGLSLSTIYSLSRGSRPSARAIAAIMAIFPDMPYERLFVPNGPAFVPQGSSKLEESRSSLKEPVTA
jgi:transcriptional regulator with XRE-family HTH domain